VIMPEDPLLVLQRIRGLKPDLLFFTEVHTEKLFQSFLASYRLAPVQVTSWLSSGTTGLANMDYYLSSRLLEQAHNPQRFYSEQLILLNEIPAYFSAPAISTQRYPRSDYGLPEHARVYLCPHLMFKMHPDFDLILAEILRSDPEAQVVLLARPDNVRYRTQLIQRLEQQMPDFMPRIWFLPKMSYPDFLSLLLLADVVLDPFYFGGGTSSFEALALGVPIVTWPGEHLHGRITGAYYQKMKLNDCIASGPSDYVKTALKLATDPVWNQQIRQAISERSSLIFDNLSAVHEMSNCLFALIKAHYESK